MSEELLVRHCAPTLAGMKTGNMFLSPFESEAQMRRDLQAFNRRFQCKGLRVVPLRYRGKKALLYVYRPAKLAEDLCHETAKNILERHGYVPTLPGKCVSCLRRKLQTDADFPHEIGLFLGYPPEDVCGFIEHKAAGYKCVGCWKVYGDAEQAQKTFAKFKKCTDVYCRQYAAGKPMERLTVAG